MTTNVLKKWASMLALVGIFLFSGVILFQLQTAFGWSNPAGSPPSGSGAIFVDSATGNVGVQAITASTTLTVNGVISAVGNVIKDVGTPGEDFDAANKLYVDAQVTGGGSTGITFFGIGKQIAPLDLINGGQTYNFTIPGGTGAPACPAGYGSILDGYGPHGVISGGGFAGIAGNMSFLGSFDPTYFLDKPDPSFSSVIDPAVIAPTYSTCSAEPYQIVPSAIPLFGTGPTSDYYGYIVAKSCENFYDNTPPVNSGFKVCNTCRICVKGYTGLPAVSGGVAPDSRWQ